MSLKGYEAACWGLIVSMKNGERLSPEQIGAFLNASQEYRFEASQRKEIYDWVTVTLVEQEYSGQKREAKGVLRRYIGKHSRPAMVNRFNWLAKSSKLSSESDG